ncbi:hypothetical protein D6779_10605, partial [Candidatus Parcubacteria bacterium]
MAQNANSSGFSLTPKQAFGVGLGLLGLGGILSGSRIKDPTVMSAGQAQQVTQNLLSGMNYDVAQALGRIRQAAQPQLNLIGTSAIANARQNLLNSFGRTLSQGGAWGGSLQRQLQNQAAVAMQNAYQKAVEDYLLNLLQQEAQTRAGYAAAASRLLGQQQASGSTVDRPWWQDVLSLGAG